MTQDNPDNHVEGQANRICLLDYRKNTIGCAYYNEDEERLYIMQEQSCDKNLGDMLDICEPTILI